MSKGTRAAYIGPSGVLAYDYANPGSRERPASEFPNPILENVPGLLLCYEKLYFLSKEFCPRDMQELPFVHFLNDSPEFSQTAQVAHDQYIELARSMGMEMRSSGNEWEQAIAPMVGDLREKLTLDSHSRGVEILPEWSVMGSPSDPDLAIADIGIALALDINELDVVVSSLGSTGLNHLELFSIEHNRMADFWRISAASHVAAIRTPAFLGIEGAYHPSYEELRNHPRVTEFRNFLRDVEPTHSDGEKLAREISLLADRHAADVLERFVKGKNKFRSVGVPVLGSALNALLPGAGAAVTGTNSALEYLSDRRLRRKVSWAPFVVDLKHVQR